MGCQICTLSILAGHVKHRLKKSSKKWESKIASQGQQPTLGDHVYFVTRGHRVMCRQVRLIELVNPPAQHRFASEMIAAKHKPTNIQIGVHIHAASVLWLGLHSIPLSTLSFKWVSSSCHPPPPVDTPIIDTPQVLRVHEGPWACLLALDTSPK